MNQKKPKTKKKSTIKNQSNKLPKVFFIVLILAILASAISYFILKDDTAQEIIKTDNILKEKEEHKKTPKLDINKNIQEPETFENKNLNTYFDELIKPVEKHEKFEEYTDEFEKDIIDTTHNENLINKENEEISKKIEEIKEKNIEEKKILDEKIQDEKKKETPVKKDTKKIDEEKIITKKDTFVYNKIDKPKLVILIDDVSTKAQKDKILNIGYAVNMAFLPPTKSHKDSAKIAQDLPFHMIHFPMQASSAFKGAEDNTLTINDSYEKIEKRVKQLREWYPKAVYTNNHTGSIFTENEEAVDKLFRALKKYNFIFVDSRTSPKSVVKKYAKKYDMPYIVRNTFIDNERNYQAIQSQLKKAILIAKKQGYAIAIGHPHSVTLQVLKESKHLLKDVEPIYLNKLPYL